MSLFYEVTSAHSFENTILKLIDSLASSNFSVLSEFNLSNKLREHNISIDEEIVILEVCNPTYAYSAISTKDNTKYLLPCRITISKKQKTTIGLVDYKALSKLNYELSETELFVLNEIKQLINLINEKK